MAIYEDAASDILHDPVLALYAVAALATRVNPRESLDHMGPEALGALLRVIHGSLARGEEKAEAERQELLQLRRELNGLLAVQANSPKAL